MMNYSKNYYCRYCIPDTNIVCYTRGGGCPCLYPMTNVDILLKACLDCYKTCVYSYMWCMQFDGKSNYVFCLVWY